MTPLNDIKSGIKTGNWQKVVTGYRKLTGESLPVPIQNPTSGDEHSKALEFYAEPANWKPSGDEFSPSPAAVAGDRGQKARDALCWAEVKAIEPTPEKPRRTRSKKASKEGEAVVLVPQAPPAKPAGQRTPSVDIDKFRVEPAPSLSPDGKKYARAEPFKPPTTNKFEDLGFARAEKAASSFDKKIAKTFVLTPRVVTETVPPFGPVRATCLHCRNQFDCDQADLSKSVDGEHEGFVGVCRSCMKQSFRRE